MTSPQAGTDIAIIGKACRFPGANSTGEFWDNLRSGRESVTFFDEADLRAAGVNAELLADPAYVRAGAVLDGADTFDAEFFGYSARDATLLDPQHRIFLECAWQALDDACYRWEDGTGPVGVFAGSSLSTYLTANLLPRRCLDVSLDGFELLIANDKDYLASRVSYKLNLDGPAVCVQTACSTSLVAVHMAAQALLGYDCDIALAGGVTVRFPQRCGYLYREGMILSPDGHCRPFDARAGGVVGGSGAGVVVCKRLEDALADGDRIDAVIKGSAINNDGARKVGYTAPGIRGQATVIAAALGAAGADPATIGAIEAHGTGTALGDPIEVAALSSVFAGHHPGGCAIGSVKSNIGHLDSAAGIAALIKAILQLENRELAPSLNFTEPNPEIKFEDTPFVVNTELRPWPGGQEPRRIGVSSFGFGGTNAHVVLEEAPAAPAPAPGRQVHVIPLSAKTAGALDRVCAGLAGALARPAAPALADVAYSLQTGRAALPHRRVLVCSTADQARPALEDPGSGQMGSRTATEKPAVAWLFPGQGTQYPGMGRDLYASEPIFREQVDACAQMLRPHIGADVRDLLFPDQDAAAGAHERLARTALAQPALFTVEYALARTLESWCGLPDAMLGHSVGEIVAACLAGVLSLEDALRVVAARGRLMQQQPEGAMLSVALPETELRGLLPDGLEIAAVNAPAHCVAAGARERIDELRSALSERGVDCGLLHTSHAFHTAMMDPAVGPFAAELATVSLSPPRVPFPANRTGRWITAGEAADPSYWAGHIRDTVQFRACAATVASEVSVLLEVGPGHTLSSLVRMDPDLRDRVVLATMPAAADEAGDEQMLMTAVGRLWLTGAAVNWAALHHGQRHRRVSLPPYPFERRRYWIAPPANPGDAESLDATVAGAVPEPRLATSEAGTPAASSRPDLLTGYTAARTPTQSRVIAIWQALLGVSPIGIHDNFIELGGHSLLATKVVTAVQAEFGVEIPLRKLVSAPTAEALAALIDDIGGFGPAAAPGDTIPAAVPNPAELHEPFPLSGIQQAQWIGRSANFSLGNVAAHIYWEVESDSIDVGRLTTAWNRIMQRHPMLRAIVMPDGRQRILQDPGRYEFDVIDLRDEPPAQADARLAGLRHQMSHEIRPSDEWPLFNIRAALLPAGRIRLFLGFDLLISDMGSVRILLRDWRAYYTDPAAVLPEPRISFRDYVLAVEQVRQSALYERSLDYWRDRVADLPPAPDLPLAAAPASLAQPRFVPCSTTLPAADWERVKARAARYGVTPSAVLLAAYAVVLAAWSRTSRFTLNVTTNNRLPVHEDVGLLVGGFASFSLMPVDLTRPRGIAEIARELQELSWADLDHRYVNGVDVLRELARSRGGTTGAVMPVVFTSTLADGAEDEQRSMVDWLGDLKHEVIQTPQVWLDAGVLEVADGLYLSWPSVEGLFPAGVVEEMFGAYCGVLAGLAGGAGWESGVGCVLPGWQRELVAGANDTGGVVAAGMLFEPLVGWAVAEPGRDAVWAGGRWLSYGELYARACGLARTLRGLGVGPGQPVAVSVGKSAEQVVAVLGVLLAGGAYLPVDPGLPEPRQDHLVGHGRARVVVAAAGGRRVWASGVRCVPVDMAGPADLGAGPPEQVGSADDLAYIIYTSGSTGAPKGVAVSHRAAANTCADVCARFGVTGADRVLGLSSLSFDLSVWDIFGVLGAGGGLVLPEPAARRDPGRWAELVAEHKVTVWNSVPALMQMYVEHIAGRADAAGPRLVLLSGDWIPLELPGRLAAVLPGARLVSLGGATEAAIWSICHPVEQVEPGWESVPYGRPMAGQSFHVLNDRLEPCPVWVTGELYIGGAGLAEGYWQDPAKTAAAFITHPGTGQRLYRTGDLGRWRPGGVIEFLGREDFQVKIGGYRIELGEIEAAMLRHPRIHTALAVAAGERHHRHLAAYLYPDPATSRSPQTDQALLAETSTLLHGHLPAYMIPTTITILDQLPLTPNGKIDRTNLPNPHQPTTHQEVSQEVSELAGRLARIAAAVIGCDQVDPAMSFFEVGGDSVIGVQIAARANDEGINLVLADLFEARTIAEAAAIIEGREQAGPAGGQAMPLTDAQRRLLGADGRCGGGWHCTEIPVAADRTIAREAVETILRRYPALRATVAWRDGEWTQQAGDVGAGMTYVPVIDLRTLPAERQRVALRQMAGEMHQEMDVAHGPLLRAALFDLTGGRRAVWLVHELAADARSWAWLLAEVAAITPAIGGAGAPGPDDDRAVLVELGRSETASILGAAAGAYRMLPGEVVLAAVSLVSGEPVIGVDFDLREAAGAAGPATVGPHSLVLPVQLPGQADDLVALKKACRAAAASVPRPGGDDAGQPPDGRPGIVLRGLGVLDGAAGELVPAVWPVRHPEARGHTEVTWAVAGGRLCVRWAAAEGDAAAKPGDDLAGRLTQALRAVGERCQAPGAGHVDRADFPLAGLDDDDLAAVLAEAEGDG